MLTVFLLSTLLLPYFLYHVAARYFPHLRDRRHKSPVRHVHDLSTTMLLGTTLYFLGGYGDSFHPIIVPATTVVTAGLYTALRESSGPAAAPAARVMQTTLPLDLRAWRWQMWARVSAAAVVMGAGIAFHVVYAIRLWGTRLALTGYLGTFCLLPLFVGMLIYGIYRLERSRTMLRSGEEDEEEAMTPAAAATLTGHRDGVEDYELEVGDGETARMLNESGSHVLGEDSDDDDDEDDEEDEEEGEGGGGGGDLSRKAAAGKTRAVPFGRGDEDDEVDEPERIRTLPPRPLRQVGPVKIKRILRIRLHHYQIFAYLAFFTRFPVIWSRCAAGIVLGGMMHGIAAYGTDSIFEYEEDRGRGVDH